MRKRKINVLEIGILGGSSLRTWRDYFPKGVVYGVDIDPACALCSDDRIFIAIGSQDDSDFMRNAFDGVLFDIIIDDGSHINTFTIASFKALFDERLRNGGYYVIEDLACSYEKLQTNHSILDWWPGMKYNNPSKSFDNERGTMDAFFEGIIKNLDHRQGNIEYVHFWSQICIIKKGDDVKSAACAEVGGQ